MDFSDYNLVSFGDSFTFGQNSTVDSDFDIIQARHKKNKIIDIDKMHIEWKNLSNSGAYPRYLGNKLNFKSTRNFGMPGASNKTIYDNIYNYCRNTDTSKDFFTIGLTMADREAIFTKRIDTDKNISLSFNYASFSDVKKSGKFLTEMYKHMSEKTVQEIMLYYRNQYTILSNFILVYDSIISLLEKKKIPYIIYDSINIITSYDTQEKLDLKENIQSSFFDKIFMDDSNMQSEYRYKADARIMEFYDELDSGKNKYYLNQRVIKNNFKKYPGTDTEISKKDIITIDNINRFTAHYGDRVLGSYKHINSPVEGDFHWGVKGHQFVANILQQWIEINYGK